MIELNPHSLLEEIRVVDEILHDEIFRIAEIVGGSAISSSEAMDNCCARKKARKKSRAFVISDERWA
jgi:hypothetical protein